MRPTLKQALSETCGTLSIEDYTDRSRDPDTSLIGSNANLSKEEIARNRLPHPVLLIDAIKDRPVVNEEPPREAKALQLKVSQS